MLCLAAPLPADPEMLPEGVCLLPSRPPRTLPSVPPWRLIGHLPLSAKPQTHPAGSPGSAKPQAPSFSPSPFWRGGREPIAFVPRNPLVICNCPQSSLRARRHPLATVFRVLHPTLSHTGPGQLLSLLEVPGISHSEETEFSSERLLCVYICFYSLCHFFGKEFQCHDCMNMHEHVCDS